MPKFKLSSGKIAILTVVAILAIDQVFKIWIKTHMTLNQEYAVFGKWFLLHFTENPGMAFGMAFGGDWGKLFLSLFRIVLVVFIGIQIAKLSRRQTPRGVTVGLALILAGAAGNIIDSMFYGLLFSESTYMQTAAFLPEGGGYASFLHGKVVDMLYFPLIKNAEGQTLFFSPVFNIADAAITIGVFYLLLFKRRFFTSHKKK
jgi:signal peptidase II